MKSRRTTLIMCFLVPIIISASYFIFRHFAPFGSSSVLTVDMGQQYVDFFAHYHDTLLHDPSGILYSFAKGLGGDMFGTWSYYLMSPLNLIILLFPVEKLPSVIAIITILKYGLSGLSFGYFIIKEKAMTNWPVIGFATTYALMGWMVANQLNTLWIDAAILLPIIFLGFLSILKGGSIKLYIISLTAMLIINYYMGWMIAIFLTAYMLIFGFAKAFPKSNQTSRRRILQWLKGSIISGGLSAWILIPTFISLLSSKTQYSKNEFRIRFEYNPLQILGKFVNGAFDFKQLPNGTANVFVASLVVILFCYYFFGSQAKRNFKIANLALTTFFILSMCFQPLDVFWHGMQLPVWYPYRFSFIFSFWMIYTAFNALMDIIKNGIHWKGYAVSMVVVMLAMTYIGVFMKQFEYLNQSNYLWGWVYLILSAGIITFLGLYHENLILALAIFFLMTGEMSLNFINSFNNISYLNNSDYTNFASIVRKTVGNIKGTDRSFYRMGTTFSRTKNDALTGNFNGGSIFSSTLESDTSNFMGDIGQPNGDAYVFYSNGTLFTDSLLSMKYFLNQRPIQTANPGKVKLTQFLNALTTKPDLGNYQLTSQNKLISTYKNPYALPIGFVTPSKGLKNSRVPNNPIAYQNKLARQLSPNIGNLFQIANYSDIKYHNVYPIMKLNNSVIRKKKMMAQSYFTIKVPIKKHTSYYMTLGPDISDKQLTILVDGQNLVQFRPSKKMVVANIANATDHDRTVNVEFMTTADNVWLQDVNIYQFNQAKFSKMTHSLKKQPFSIKKWNNHTLNGTINVKANNQSLTTTIPYSKGWHVTVDNHTVTPRQWAKMFLYIPISKGHHQVKFTYWPVGLFPGILITGMTCIWIGTDYYLKKRKKYD